MSNPFLDRSWQRYHIADIKKRAGARYSPQINVELPIGRVFSGLSRDEEFFREVRGQRGKLERAAASLHGFASSPTLAQESDFLKSKVSDAVSLVSHITQYNTKPIAWDKIAAASEGILEVSRKLLDLTWKEEQELRRVWAKDKGSDISKEAPNFNAERHHLYELEKAVRFFSEQSTTNWATLSNKQRLLLLGQAGTGKTHLLCDVAENRADAGKPSILLFGEFFRDGTPLLAQAISQLRLPAEITEDNLLSELDAAALATSSRAILAIDALNETPARSFWRRELPKLLASVQKYPNVALVVSVRHGFEEEVIPAQSSADFVCETHPGFAFREFEATSKYFHEFGIPLPEIPVLMPEFRIPLFLLLFCKGISEREKKTAKKKKKGKQSFRGHEGATYIFEHFVKAGADRIAKEFGLHPGRDSKGRYVIWDTVIEQIAANMSRGRIHQDHISERRLHSIIRAAHPGADPKLMAQSLERNFLITKVPNYQKGQPKGYLFRFPYQKFSDHLIVRFLLKNLPSDRTKLAAKFMKTSRHGKLLLKSWRNKGLIEALSIQIPERTGGIELVDAAPWARNDRVVRDAFLESLIWRDPRRFHKNRHGAPVHALKYINTVVVQTDEGNRLFLNVLLTVTANPDHPFNAQLLHRHLFKQSLSKRDALWSQFLHNEYGEHEAVDRLLNWAFFDPQKSKASDTAVEFAATALAWFLTTSNRYLRDRATKALIQILVERLPLLINLLAHFDGVNDPYVSQRLYAVAYGCTLRNTSGKGLKEIAESVYARIFRDGAPPPDMLLRDYARGVIEAAQYRGVPISFSLDDVRPPYRSDWPTEIPTEESLKQKFYEPAEADRDSNRGFFAIWFSVMSFGDFARYIIGTNSNRFDWSTRPLLKPRTPSLRNKYDQFIGELNAEQASFWENFSQWSALRRVRWNESEDSLRQQEIGAASAEAEHIFISSLSPLQQQVYQNVVVPFKTSGEKDEFQFDLKVAQCWIFNRVMELGWTSGLHGKFDAMVGRNDISRTAHKSERIGKKYQWIAYHEFLARVSDNFEFRGDSWDDNPRRYEGPWQLRARDIDPSYLLPDRREAGKEQIWQMRKPVVLSTEAVSPEQWLPTTDDIPSIQNVVSWSRGGRNEWLVLHGFLQWQEETLPEYEKYQIPQRELWFIARSYIVPTNESEPLVQWLRQRRFGRWLESGELHKMFLYEYPWAPAYKSERGSEDLPRNESVDDAAPTNVFLSADEYLHEASGLDCSIEDTLNITLPSRWLLSKSNLRQGEEGEFVDTSGQIRMIDPSVKGSGPAVLFSDKTHLLQILNAQHMSLVFHVIGEKQQIGGDMAGRDYKGRLEIHGSAVLLSDGTIEGRFDFDFDPPSHVKTTTTEDRLH